MQYFTKNVYVMTIYKYIYIRIYPQFPRLLSRVYMLYKQAKWHLIKTVVQTAKP